MSDADIQTYTAFLIQIVPEIQITPENVAEIFMQPQFVAKYLSVVFSPAEFDVPEIQDLSTQARIDALNDLFIQIPSQGEQEFALKCVEGLCNCDHDSILDILDMLYYVYDEKQKSSSQNVLQQRDNTAQMIEQLQLKIKEKQDSITELEDQVKNLKTENQQQQQQIFQLNNVNKEKQALLQQQSKYQDQIQSQKQYISNLEQQNHSLTNQITTQENAIEQIKDQSQQLKSQISGIFQECFNMQLQNTFDKQNLITVINQNIQERIDQEVSKQHIKQVGLSNAGIQTEVIKEDSQTEQLVKQLEKQTHDHQLDIQNIEQFVLKQLNNVLDALKQQLSLDFPQIQAVIITKQGENAIKQCITTKAGQFTSIDQILNDSVTQRITNIEIQAQKQLKTTLEEQFQQQQSLQEQKYKQLELQNEQLMIQIQNSEALLNDAAQKSQQMQQKITGLNDQLLKQEEQISKLSKKVQKYKDLEKTYKDKEGHYEIQKQAEQSALGVEPQNQSQEQANQQQQLILAIYQQLTRLCEKIDDNSGIMAFINAKVQKYTESYEQAQFMEELLNIITQITNNILTSQRRSKQNDEKNDTIRELKSLLYQLQEHLLKEIFLRIKAQFSKENKREIRITFNEVNILAKLEEVNKNQYEQFIQKIFNSMLVEEQWQQYSQKLQNVNRWITSGKMNAQHQ